MSEFPPPLLVGVALVVIPVSIGLWIWQLLRVFRGQPILAAPARRPVPWTLVDLLIIGLTGFAILALSQWWCLRQFDLPPGAWDLSDLNPQQQISVLVVFSASSLLTWLAAVMICRWRSKATAADLGWDGCYMRHDLALGLGAFAMLIVPVLLIHFLLQNLLPTDETHPFVDLIMDDPRTEYLLPIALAALVAAPLVEEYFFRVLLQGWLERLTAKFERSEQLEISEPLPRVDAQVDVLPSDKEGDVDNPYRTPSEWERVTMDLHDDEAADEAAATRARPSQCVNGLPDQPSLRWLAIGISSLIFALAHFGQGPAPVSLFVLALGLGYLYQRTHRVLPGMVVHFLVNLTAISQLALAVAEGQG